ncbi:MAG: tetratricopeptide repeat protein [Proteobacteria bacterium]|nr:tetratricopeptide repeat protein [Pseudomonadota bacterium]
MNRAEKRRQQKLAKKAGKKGGASSADELQALVLNGHQLYQNGQMAEAEAVYRQVLDIDPGHAEANHLLGVVAHQTARVELAVELISKAVQAMPGNAIYHLNLGNALNGLGRFKDALASYVRALVIQPEFAEAHSNRGNAERDLGQLDAALVSYRAAVALKPDFAEAHNNLGNLYRDLERPQDAVDSSQRAIAARPGYAAAYNNLGNGFRDLGRVDDAVASYEAAIGLSPDFAKAHHNLSLGLLSMGDFGRGWAEYEWRWKSPDFPDEAYDYPHPRWNGEDLTGKRIVVSAEQGIGDEIMYASMLAELVVLAGPGGEVLVECNDRMVSIFRRCIDGVTFVDKTAPPDRRLLGADIDFHIPMASLCRYLRPDAGKFPSREGFLTGDVDRVDGLRRRYREWSDDRAVVGIAWRSGNAHSGIRRSIDLTHLHPILSNPSCLFVNLQYGDVDDDLARLKDQTGIEVRDDDEIDPLADMDGFTAQVAAMDRVISIDNSTVHMAGALGVSVWTLLPFVADWRWMIDRNDSPWYPTMQLFRQQTPGDWEGVIDRVADHVSEGI